MPFVTGARTVRGGRSDNTKIVCDPNGCAVKLPNCDQTHVQIS